MTGWRRICCAVDFSDPSRSALNEAADLARRFRAELTVIHVHEDPGLVSAALDVPPEPLRRAAADLEPKLAAWRAGAQLAATHPVHSAMLVGAPAAEILRFVARESFDLLVVATHGRTGPVLGSVAERVVRDATCPVLVVRWLGAWAGKDRVREGGARCSALPV
jgi:nucleotide-binding universal stress UspA family protein